MARDWDGAAVDDDVSAEWQPASTKSSLLNGLYAFTNFANTLEWLTKTLFKLTLK